MPIFNKDSQTGTAQQSSITKGGSSKGIFGGNSSNVGTGSTTGNAITVQAGDVNNAQTTTLVLRDTDAGIITATQNGKTTTVTFSAEQGPQGEAGQISIGTTTTLATGENATVTNTGSSENAVLNFGLPRGPKGDAGDAFVFDTDITSTKTTVTTDTDLPANPAVYLNGAFLDSEDYSVGSDDRTITFTSSIYNGDNVTVFAGTTDGPKGESGDVNYILEAETNGVPVIGDFTNGRTLIYQY